jgi:UDP-N-acetylglucosamine--N-acetylmuramyl-(pentapeptide) pyrophosphoryl-undecaprenol N-acetylglucosamine transferase
MTIKKTKKIMLVGGGSGGHLTPLVSVAHAIKRASNDTLIIFVGQRGENLREIVDDPSFDYHESIKAGKFRRYYGETLWQHLKDIRTILANVRDLFRFIHGTFQAYRLIGRYKPDAVFLKGGFVSVPVGIAARLRGVPYVTHDSDAIPGLANRITAKHAVLNTTALPAEIYPYKSTKTRQVGIPIQSVFRQDTEEQRAIFRSELGIPNKAVVIVSVGGGLGAQAINKALISDIHELLRDDTRYLIHFTGKKSFESTKEGYEKKGLSESERNRLLVIDFTTELFKYTSIADVVISRAGATNIAELARQAKLCVIVPAPHLTGGQQLHNAKILEERHAAVILQEKALSTLSERVDSILTLPQSGKERMTAQLNELSIPQSAEKIADILLKL